jgi:hypothetical protein
MQSSPSGPIGARGTSAGPRNGALRLATRPLTSAEIATAVLHAKEMPTGDMAFKENSRGPGAHRAPASREARDGGEVRDQPERAMGDCACHKKCLTTVNNYDLITLLHGEGLSQLRRPEVPTGASFFLRDCWR